MLSSILVLPDGTELTSGIGQINNIRTTTLTECVNSGEELTPGSVCASMMESTVQTPMGGLALTAGDELTLFKVGGDGIRHQVGLFTLEKPTRPSASILKLTGYDRITRLDKDLTAWLKSLAGWPYTLLEFARMVCTACGLRLVTAEMPNGDYPIQRITREATGRQLMQWIGQICCRFCRATPFGDVELAWYTPSGVHIGPTGERYFFQRSLVYEDYDVVPIEAVQVRLTDSEDGAPIPTVPEGTNSYVISGNPLFTAVTAAVLDNIMAELDGLTYTPCKVSIPTALDIHAGHTVDITDANGVTIKALVMTRKQSGQRDTLESTGSPRRDSTTALNNRTIRDQSAEYERRALIAGKDAVKNQTPEEVFAALTDNGAIQGIYLQDGKIYINAEFVSIVNLVASSIVSGMLKSANGLAWFDLDRGFFAIDGKAAEDGSQDGIRLMENRIYGLRTDADGFLRTSFDLTVTANALTMTDGTWGGKMPGSGLPIQLWSSGGLDLGNPPGEEGDRVRILGKELFFHLNSDGETYTLMARKPEEEETT